MHSTELYVLRIRKNSYETLSLYRISATFRCHCHSPVWPLSLLAMRSENCPFMLCVTCIIVVWNANIEVRGEDFRGKVLGGGGGGRSLDWYTDKTKRHTAIHNLIRLNKPKHINIIKITISLSYPDSVASYDTRLSPNSTWIVTSRLDTIRHVRLVEPVELVEQHGSTRSSRRARHFERVVTCRDVTWRAKWNFGIRKRDNLKSRALYRSS